MSTKRPPRRPPITPSEAEWRATSAEQHPRFLDEDVFSGELAGP